MITLRALLHPILVMTVMTDRLLRKQRVSVLNRSRLSELNYKNGPYIFAPTHCGKYDIQILTEVLRNHLYYLLSGDPYNLPGTVEGTWLLLNGVVYVDRDSKESRISAKEKLIQLLLKHNNVMLYPEGTWNLSDNALVLRLYKGIVEIARSTGAKIVPFGLEISDESNVYYVNIGNCMDVANIDDSTALRSLRDEMASLKYEIIEVAFTCHEQYDAAYLKADWQKYVSKRLSECSYMSYDLIWKYARKDKATMDYSDVFEHIRGICKKENAYLFHHNVYVNNDRFSRLFNPRM